MTIVVLLSIFYLTNSISTILTYYNSLKFKLAKITLINKMKSNNKKYVVGLLLGIYVLNDQA